MITISRLPAAEEHERCSSAAGRKKYIQATVLGLSVPAEQFITKAFPEQMQHIGSP
jgi:hypothetical protein